MRKKLLVLSVLIVAILPLLLIPTVLPKRQLECPTYVSGDWCYIPQILDKRVCGNDVVLKTEEEGTWTGDVEGTGFEGTSYDYPCTVVVHGATIEEGAIIGFEAKYFTGIVNFQGTVNGKRGRLKMYVVGKQFPGQDWHGTWRIVIGWGKLRRVQGFGTWWGPGFTGGPEPGEIDYDGWIFFNPK